MPKLLAAGFVRLKKSKILWILLITMFVLQTMSINVNYQDMKRYPGYICKLDELFFNYVIYSGIAIAVFCSLFLGTEYSDGTIRNKLMVGHTRISIYLSNLILCSVAGALICIAGILPSFFPGILLLGSLEMDLMTAAALILSSISAAIAYASLFTLASMLIHSKAVSAVTTILAAFALLLISSGIYSALSQPEIWDSYFYAAAYDENSTEKAQPNPFYVRGAKREFYEFLMDFLPSGQADEIVMQTASPARIVFYDACILLLTSGAGIVCFQKKDIK